jgi:hypothetical protein
VSAPTQPLLLPEREHFPIKRGFSSKPKREDDMADNGGSNAMMGLIIGGLVVFVVLIFAFGWYPGGTRTADVNISAPKIDAPSAPKVPSK